MASFLLLEDPGSALLLEDGVSRLILEDDTAASHSAITIRKVYHLRSASFILCWIVTATALALC